MDGSPVAAAALIYVNPNLNCGAIPTPSGRVIAPTTHLVQMSWADLLFGFLSGLLDFAIQVALSWIIGKISKRISGFLNRHFGAQILTKYQARKILRNLGLLAPSGGRNAQYRILVAFSEVMNERTGEIFDLIVNNTIGFGVGGPMGADAGDFGFWTPGGAVTEWAQGGLENLYYGSAEGPAAVASTSVPALAPTVTPEPPVYSPAVESYFEQGGIEEFPCRP
ncbi:hypothetical protein DB30_04396 [Enhygromyxa salina]|uniref:Uncharacterized protein n=1 Tax=Enhygromyxa salina TaxID=215803 RepID=A0A0C1ZZ17_9BACT|nr:hypothetical protein DB30_04396 [Enhygromyxa salina]